MGPIHEADQYVSGPLRHRHARVAQVAPVEQDFPLPGLARPPQGLKVGPATLKAIL